ncbi:hypothetical protein HLI_14580 [Halobacillus litoralis]|uniref:Uncharacterized protein n=2 Tax=Halobacillus litoralis TaxID=45668 RepID=A0A410MF52_9BACI|nr:hypothetical protein HLI_14580 [Halobacillus litoralis]
MRAAVFLSIMKELSLMAKKLAWTGFIMFMAGIGIFLINFMTPFHFLVPLLTIGGICIMAIATILSIRREM